MLLCVNPPLVSSNLTVEIVVAPLPATFLMNPQPPDLVTPGQQSLSSMHAAGAEPADIMQTHGVHYSEVCHSVWLVIDAINQCPQLQLICPGDHNVHLSCIWLVGESVQGSVELPQDPLLLLQAVHVSFFSPLHVCQ